MSLLKPAKKIWISPNGKYRVVGIQFPDELTATIFVDVEGRKHRLTYGSMRAHGKLPKYVVQACEQIKQELAVICNHCKSN
ncbi:hypothetical protein [Anoxybacteroides rupiense]|uniref:hypothetical protein n=1 Tax=Anoxybacteroides rupiense TaxID=311460 RepID=UPI00366D719D